MTGMDKLEFRGMEHPARNNEIWSICVKSEPYGFFPTLLDQLGLISPFMLTARLLLASNSFLVLSRKELIFGIKNI